MPYIAIWRGDEDEANALVLAVTRNCMRNDGGKPCDHTCGAHAIMREKTTLEMLLFMRRIASHLREQEFYTRRRSPA